MRTTINGKDARWPADVADRFRREVPDASKVTDANYFTSRPPVDEWNRGSPYAGFVYVVQTNGISSVYMVNWIP